MSDTIERDAGSLILKDLALFNKATILFSGKIEDAIQTAFGKLVQEWLRECDWKTRDFGDYSFWVYPSKWKGEREDAVARFVFANRPRAESVSYVLADMCGVGQADWGFEFVVNWSSFGGSAGRAEFTKGMAGLPDELVRNGWINLGKSVFFRSIRFNAGLLAAAWESEDWSEFLAPLKQALSSLVADQAIFDKVITEAHAKAE